ncbi:MAG: diguanylate cyclase [Thermodesulfobacteriota bacterium]
MPTSQLTDRTQKILLVDDEPVNVRILQNLLKGMCKIFFALNGKTALEIATRELPDLILLDIMMPEMDGHEVLRRLKRDEQTKDIPIIFVTAMKEMEDERLGLELGAVDYITKPFNPAVIAIRVKNHLKFKQQHDLLRGAAIKDDLTGSYNRRFFDEVLVREWRRAIRSEDFLSVILMDIDQFRAFNDNYGHNAGDDCLRLIAHALEEVAKRAADLVARYGGEEFGCILPGTNRAGVLRVAERFRKSVEELAIPHAYSCVADHVTISLGAACVIPSPDAAPKILLEGAEMNLSLAKKAGCNQLAMAPAEGE